MIKNSIIFRKRGSDAWWETNCVLRCWVRSRTERTSIHGNTAKTPIFSGKACHWLKSKLNLKKNLWNMALTFDKGLIDQVMLYIHSRSYQSYWGAGEELYNIGAILTKLWHILNCMMFYIHSLTRSVLLSFWDVTICWCTVSDSDL